MIKIEAMPLRLESHQEKATNEHWPTADPEFSLAPRRETAVGHTRISDERSQREETKKRRKNGRSN